ncbi:MAG: AAA family ATPase, partial [Rhodothermales bacterium]|nr:AAA family ATPase [Rhodothermales bacterium]
MLAATKLLDRIRELNHERRQRNLPVLEIRIGIHTGLVIIEDRPGLPGSFAKLKGKAPEIAAGLPGLDDGDSIVVSETTFALLRRGFEGEPLQPRRVKGLRERVKAVRIRHGEAESTVFRRKLRVDVPLVGRDVEKGLLLQRWESIEEGLGQGVLLSGEAGIGKSRLVRVLEEYVAALANARVFMCQCSAYHSNSSLHPIIEALRAAIRRNGSDETIDDGSTLLQAFLKDEGITSDETVALISSLLGTPTDSDISSLRVSPEMLKAKTFEALAGLFIRMSARAPLLFVVEDVHWSDPSTAEFIGILIERCRQEQMLMLLTYRPDFDPPWPTRAHITPVTIARFGHGNVRQMISEISNGKQLPPRIVDQILDKADGVPMFVEEVTKTVLQSEWLHLERDEYVLVDKAPDFQIPATLQDLLSAKLDAMGPSKAVAQVGAILGREFTFELLRHVTPDDITHLEERLEELVLAELLLRRGIGDEVAFTFRHALIQDAAYNSLLIKTRRQLHEQTASTIENHFADVVQSQPELLAQHLTKAELPERAIPYWQLAGVSALQKWANLEAASHLQTGLDLLNRIPESRERDEKELEIRLSLGPALMMTRGFNAPDVEQAYSRAKELVERTPDSPYRFLVTWGLWGFYAFKGDRLAFDLTQMLSGQAAEIDDPAVRIQAHLAAGTLDFGVGRFRTARENLR